MTRRVKLCAFLFAIPRLKIVALSGGTNVPPITKNNSAQLTKQQLRYTSSIDLAKSLQGLETCKTGSAARELLENTFKECSSNNNDDKNAQAQSRYKSVSIPRGATEVSIRDGDLATQTGIRGKSVADLIETDGSREVDRASVFLICLIVASSALAVVVYNSLTGVPEILRFVIVWLLSFAPLAFVGGDLPYRIGFRVL